MRSNFFFCIVIIIGLVRSSFTLPRPTRTFSASAMPRVISRSISRTNAGCIRKIAGAVRGSLGGSGTPVCIARLVTPWPSSTLGLCRCSACSRSRVAGGGGCRCLCPTISLAFRPRGIFGSPNQRISRRMCRICAAW